MRPAHRFVRRPGASSGLAAEHATAPQSCGASMTCLYLPREVFFGRLVFAGAFVPVCASDFGRFFPATSGSFRLMCSAETLATAGLPVLEDLPFPRRGRE